jgi:hypothetical protein
MKLIDEQGFFILYMVFSDKAILNLKFQEQYLTQKKLCSSSRHQIYCPSHSYINYKSLW